MLRFDYYIKKTKDWLITAPILATAGADAPLINGGDVKNTGVELSLELSQYHWQNSLIIRLASMVRIIKTKIGNIPTNDQYHSW